jgi:hypothetical protein
LQGACRRAFGVYADAGALDKMRQAAMARRFHWSNAAEAYEKLYGRLTGRPTIKRSRLNAAPMAPAPRRRAKETLRVAA